MARDNIYGLCWEAESWQLACLRELDIQCMFFPYIVSLPPRLESAAFRDARLKDAVWLGNCKCAKLAPIGNAWC